MATVLLVDSTDSFVELEKFFLQGHGHHVVTARSGEECLAQLDEVQPDALLIDLNLSGIAGDEVCRRLRDSARWASLPVIVVTAAGGEEEVRRCLDAGCDDYLTKPVAKGELLEKVQRLLGRVRRRTAERAAVSFRVVLQCGEERFRGLVRDISATGIFVRSDRVVAPGTVVSMHLELPGGKALPVHGKVKRSVEEGMGIYFINLDGRGRKIIDALVARSRSDVAPPPAEFPPTAAPDELASLRRRIVELEEENRSFADQIVRAEEANNALSNLYVASSRFHAVLDRARVAAIINEVVINFVGAEKFALLLFDAGGGELRYEAGEGFDQGEFPPLDVTGEPWREVVQEGRSRFREEAVALGSDDLQRPIAAIPLRIHDETIGALAVYRLFVHKDAFSPLDYQLFAMLAQQAAGALFATRLYEASERKRETYRGFMDLLLK